MLDTDDDKRADGIPLHRVIWNVMVNRNPVRTVLFVLTAFLVFNVVWSLLPPGETAPTSDVASRRRWGNRVFGVYLRHVDDWARAADVIRRDVGDVKEIAPIGGPNFFQGGFTDGSYATMKLEVIGTRGTGILQLPEIEIWTTGELHSIGRDATWEFGGEEHLVVGTGMSYLDELGLEPIYADLLELADREAAQEFVSRWAEFELALEELEPGDNWGGDRSPSLIPLLHDRYREPVLIHLAAALGELDRADEGVGACRQAAETALGRARDRLQIEDHRRQLTRVARDLQVANTALKLANTLAPNNKAVLSLARERAELQFLHSIGGRPRPIYTEHDTDDQPWAEKCLGILYCEAAEYPRRSPFLERTLVKWRTRISTESNSILYINEDNVYAARVYLQLVGRRRHGELEVRIAENPRRCRPIDLFADVPRVPDYPLTITSPRWSTDESPIVKLSAKTGEPMSKKRLTNGSSH